MPPPHTPSRHVNNSLREERAEGSEADDAAALRGGAAVRAAHVAGGRRVLRARAGGARVPSTHCILFKDPLKPRLDFKEPFKTLPKPQVVLKPYRNPRWADAARTRRSATTRWASSAGSATWLANTWWSSTRRRPHLASSGSISKDVPKRVSRAPGGRGRGSTAIRLPGQKTPGGAVRGGSRRIDRRHVLGPPIAWVHPHRP